MKIISFALCLAAMALVAVEAAPGSVGSHFRARMVHNKSLFQKRDPNSDACKEVKPTGFVMLAKLNKALQGYSSDDPQADDLIKVRKFETAMADANSNQDEDHYAKIKDAYVAAAEALRTSQNGKTKDVSVAAKDMMDTVDKIREKCKKP